MFDGLNANAKMPLVMGHEGCGELYAINDERTDIKVGDNVHVISGALKDFAGEVEEINARTQKLKVRVSMFGRPTSVELDFTQVEKLNLAN